jgi:hypothetical protein
MLEMKRALPSTTPRSGVFKYFFDTFVKFKQFQPSRSWDRLIWPVPRRSHLQSPHNPEGRFDNDTRMICLC